MKTKYWKLVIVAAVSVVILGVAAMADKHKKVLLSDAVKAVITKASEGGDVKEVREEVTYWGSNIDEVG